MIRISFLAMASLLTLAGPGQITVDVPLQFTGPEEQRKVEGLGPPLDGSAAITVNATLTTGSYAWANGVLNGDTILLSMSPAPTTYRDGLLVRFKALEDMHGSLYARAAPGLPALPIVRTDGLQPAMGQLREGRIAEMVCTGGRFILMNAAVSDCPSGFIQVTERLCVERVPVTGMLFHNAMQRCADLGGKLCAWDEYVAACLLHGADLQDLLLQWEWLDETSDHTHGADQAGFETCTNRRQRADLHLPTNTGNGRCCYHPR